MGDPFMPLSIAGFFGGIGLQELILILVVALLVFGNRLPEVARSIGKGYREFRRGLANLESQIEMEDADVDVSDAKAPGRTPGPPATGAAPVSGVENPDGAAQAGSVPVQPERPEPPAA